MDLRRAAGLVLFDDERTKERRTAGYNNALVAPKQVVARLTIIHVAFIFAFARICVVCVPSSRHQGRPSGIKAPPPRRRTPAADAIRWAAPERVAATDAGMGITQARHPARQGRPFDTMIQCAGCGEASLPRSTLTGKIAGLIPGRIVLGFFTVQVVAIINQTRKKSQRQTGSSKQGSERE
jgi:hypothetical protein